MIIVFSSSSSSLVSGLLCTLGPCSLQRARDKQHMVVGFVLRLGGARVLDWDSNLDER